jgi:hypothetical protein
MVGGGTAVTYCVGDDTTPWPMATINSMIVSEINFRLALFT